MKQPLTVLLFLALFPLCATASTIHVPADKPTIQAAINVAGDGDTILLADGTYTGAGNSELQLRGRAITLSSENGSEHCIIDGQGAGAVLWINRSESWNTVIQGLTFTGGETGVYINNSSPTIRNCSIEENDIGIRIYSGSLDSDPLIESTLIRENLDRGIVIGDRGSIYIIDSVISRNGGGVQIDGGFARIINCLIIENHTPGNGGGLFFNFAGSAYIVNSTIADNTAQASGGGLCATGYSGLLVKNCIIAGNSADIGDQYALYDFPPFGAILAISYSDVVGTTHVAWHAIVDVGEGMIYQDPLFTGGPVGDHLLSQAAAGQGITSPCVDSGDPESERVYGTTRTDLVSDLGVVDMGFHYRDPGDDHLPDTQILSGPMLFNTGVDIPNFMISFTGTDHEHPASALTYSWRITGQSWSPWSAETWAAITNLEETTDAIRFEVRARDPDGDIDPSPAWRVFSYDSDHWSGEEFDVIAVAPGPGPGNPTLVRTGLGHWAAYTVMQYGVNLAAGDIDGDDIDEVITGPGPGSRFSPHVRCFRPDGTVVPNAGFHAYGTARYGCKVAAGDVDGDGFDEIITGAGPGAVFGPHVRGWNWDGGPASTPIPGINFFAYGTLKWGVNVACGDIDGDGIDEIITGAGPGAVFGPHVRGWSFDGDTVSPMAGVSWLAFGTPRWGVTVGCGDLDGDGKDEIITGAGPGPDFGPHVRTWNYDSGSISQMPGISFFAYPFGQYGVEVAAAAIRGNEVESLITMPGPGPSNKAWLRIWRVNSGEPVLSSSLGNYVALDSWLTHGGTVAGSKNGWE